MTKFDHIIQHERRIRAFTGLDMTLFHTLLASFAAVMDDYLERSTLDGYIREGDRAITYTNSPLPTAADRLLFILTYLKQNAIQEVHGQLFGMSQPNVSKWVRLLLDILNQALAVQGVLPARTSSELQAYLQAVPPPNDPEAPPFFVRMARSDR
jgi:DDE superfamily endonuclease